MNVSFDKNASHAFDEWMNTLLATPSPTYDEKKITDLIANELTSDAISTTRVDDNLWCQPKKRRHQRGIILVGHSDVVPAHFPPRLEGQHLHGAGASDMKGALAVFTWLYAHHFEALQKHVDVALIVYAREEGTPLKDNGLYALLQTVGDDIRQWDLAIVGEPTNNDVQIGCVGSIHAKVSIDGKACHSARPWNGDNALYKALPFINAMAKQQRQKHTLFDVDFFDVMHITESACSEGRTTIPGNWQCNVNFRFAPARTLAEARAYLLTTLHDLSQGIATISIIDEVDAGAVIENIFFQHVMTTLARPVTAKQAWTDVAQLTACGIAAFNYGPGLTEQAHCDDEYIDPLDLHNYLNQIYQLLTQQIQS